MNTWGGGGRTAGVCVECGGKGDGYTWDVRAARRPAEAWLAAQAASDTCPLVGRSAAV